MNPERLFTVLRQPHFTEKSTWVTEKHNQYVFSVATDSTKAEIREAVEQLFSVKVASVTTLNVKGKVKRTNRGESRKKDWKKAYVRLQTGQQIDFSTID